MTLSSVVWQCLCSSRYYGSQRQFHTLQQLFSYLHWLCFFRSSEISLTLITPYQQVSDQSLWRLSFINRSFHQRKLPRRSCHSLWTTQRYWSWAGQQQLWSFCLLAISMSCLPRYSISAAFGKCQIELYIAAALQRRFKKRPNLFLLAIMLMGLFLSMWISNHTAPVLCVSVRLQLSSLEYLNHKPVDLGSLAHYQRLSHQQCLCENTACRLGLRL